MSTDLLPKSITDFYETIEWRHACAILKYDFPEEWNNIITVLENFRLPKSSIIAGGGRKSKVSNKIDEHFYSLGWEEKMFNTKVVIDNESFDSPTHKIDCYKNKIALEIEWNNKDPFFDRDLNNFRLLFDLHAISVGIIVTRCDHLQNLFKKLGKGTKYGSSTTHISKLKPRIQGGGGGGCPILVFGISDKLYVNDIS